jgi:hypothetical protein
MPNNNNDITALLGPLLQALGNLNMNNNVQNNTPVIPNIPNQIPQMQNNQQRGRRPRQITYFQCQQFGHFARNCPLRTNIQNNQNNTNNNPPIQTVNNFAQQ